MPRNSNCRKCSLWRTTTNVCVWGDGPTDAEVTFIGEAPGEAEARSGKPFMGRSGQLLRSTTKEVGLKSAYITNVVKCRPPNNREPTKEEIIACREYLDEELATVKSKAVVALGATASKAVLKKAKITQVHGQILEKDGRVTMPCYHPAYVLRDPGRQPAFRAALEKLRAYLDGDGHSSSEVVHLVDETNFGQFIEAFEAAEEFSFDTETTSLFPHDGKGRVRCLGIGLPQGAWSIPMNMDTRPFLSPKGQRLLVELLVDCGREKFSYAQNGKFDNLWLRQYYGAGFYVNFDLGLAQHTLDENAPQNLKDMVRGYLNEPEYDLPLKEKLSDEDPERTLHYCGLDAAYTLRIGRLLRAKLRKEPTARALYQKLVMPAARAFERVDSRGLFVNLSKMDGETEKVKRELIESEIKLNQMAGGKINWNSPAQVAKVLYHDLELPINLKTDKGAPSTSEDALIDLRESHPIVNELVVYREKAKYLSTYLLGLREFMVGPQLYLSTKINGTVTGRYSSRLHSIPRDGSIRNIVEAPPGWVFVQGDLSQAEVRVVAEMSGDAELMRCFIEGIDVHWRILLHMINVGGGEYVEPALETAKKHLGRPAKGLGHALDVLAEIGHERAITIWKGWKEARKKAKGVVFGFIYGMGAPKFVEYAKSKYGFEPTLEEAQVMRTAFFGLFPGLEPWHDRQRKLARAHGLVYNLAGRARHLPGVDSSDKSLRHEAERQAINAPVQGYIGDHKAAAVVELEDTFDPDTELRVVAEHHDAILMWARPHKLDRVLPRAGKIMAHPAPLKALGVELSVPMVAEFEVGPWGAGKAFKLNDSA